MGSLDVNSLFISVSLDEANGFLYKKIDDVAIGSPLGSSLANAFLSYHETGYTIFRKDFSQFLTDIMSMIFLYSENRMITHLKYFQDFLNSYHINMSFFMETEKGNTLSFLGV